MGGCRPPCGIYVIFEGHRTILSVALVISLIETSAAPHPTRTADADSWIDERMISQALAHLGIGPLDRFFNLAGELV
jgi:hypothetical protein